MAWSTTSRRFPPIRERYKAKGNDFNILIDFRHVCLVKILYFSFFAARRLRIPPEGQ
jgi:hypothetical protein